MAENKINIYHDDGNEFILYKILKENKVNIIKLTPAHLSLLKDMDNSNSSVNRFIVGGDDLKSNLAANIYENFKGNIEIYNEYGPTETVVGCMIHKFDISKDKELSVPIGVPADNVQIYILDKDLNIVPPETSGELYISGAGVGRGYLNRESLTKNRFILNPFIEGNIMYKTGDSAKYKSDGKIEYIGRLDRQVKIRGYRIELGEIEKHLIAIKEISEAVATDYEDENGDKKICAYITTINEISVTNIKEYLLKFLPNYMVPVHFIFLENMPLTRNGKIDIKDLPKPELIKKEENAFINYRNENEKKLIEVMQKVLNIKEIGISDNFFELGGDSIKAIQIVSKLNNTGLTIRVKDILSNNTIEGMAACIKVVAKIQLEKQSACEGTVESTPISSWFFNQSFRKMEHWNQSVLLEISENVSNDSIKEAINELIKHHDTLRLNYNSQIQKLYYNEKHLKGLMTIKEFNLAQLSEVEQDLAIKQLGENFKESFSIEKDLLFKGCIFELGYRGKRLLLTAHHLIIDGVSWQIILEDLNALIIQDKKELPLKTCSMQKWAIELEKYSNSDSIKEEISYWNTVIKNKVSYPVTFNLGNDTLEFSSTVKAVLDEEETEALITKANKAYGTEGSELLIIALALTASKFSQMETITLELEGHGREEIVNAIDLSRSVGWFTNMYPVNLSIEGMVLNSEIKKLKEQLRIIPNKGFNYGVLKYINKTIDDDDKKMIRFNYLGEFDSMLKNSLFQITNQDSGADFGKDNHMNYLIEIIAVRVEKKLNISITYSKNKFSEESIQNFMKEYLQLIKNIVAHCCNKDYKEFTPSDFDGANISQEDLDSLFD